MKHKISELEGALLDAAVAKIEMENDPRISMWGDRPWLDDDTTAGHGMRGRGYRPSTDPRDGWPIIERENISVIWGGSDVWFAVKSTELGVSGSVRDEETGIISPITLALYGRSHKGKTSLIAAMRAYLASSYGDEVELP